MSLPQINEAEIVAYYENCQIDYSLVWDLDVSLCMHYGYWEEETKDIREAVRLMNIKLAEIAGITSEDYVCRQTKVD